MSCINTTRSKACRRAGREKGSALLLVVAVGALVTLMTFTWVAFSVRRSKSVIEMRDGLRARYAAESVVSRAIYERTLNPHGLAARDTVFAADSADSTRKTGPDSLFSYVDSVRRAQATASLGEEGSYLRVTADGKSGVASCAIDALFGREPPRAYRCALILFEQNKRLDIRKGRIVGDAWLAQKPVGTVRGKVQTGAAILPAVAEDKFAAELKILDGKMAFPEHAEVALQSSQAFDERSLPPIDSGKDLFVSGNVLINGGSARPLFIRGPAALVATGDVQISGNVTADGISILALGQVKCFDNVRLRGVTIYSQSLIDLEDDVRCSGNLYAFQTVILAGRAAVEMPSVVYIRGVESNDLKKSMFGLQLLEGSSFSGTAFCAKGATLSMIEKNAKFTGLFYTRGHLALRGTVFGCVAASMLVESMESQKNVLDGGTIDRTALPDNFTVPPAFAPDSARYRLAAWDESVSSRKGK